MEKNPTGFSRGSVNYQISSPDWDSENGNLPLDRTDLDMFYINIGGGDHVVAGTFYVRNLVINSPE